MGAASRSFAALVLVVGLSGCGLLPFYTRANKAFHPDAKPTRATRMIALEELPNGVFVGIALSGGGSRAANFSAAVLFELEELGLLQKAVAISSVSGSSLTAAYYGLFGHDPTRWNRERVKELLRKDFQTRWILRWFLPHNIVRYWFTNFDRSDIMKGVFDDHLFEKKTFGNMPGALPKILINATNLTTEKGISFTDQSFKTLESRLDTYPVSHAVVASSAFPGVFNNVTLQNYSIDSPRPHYVHLFDGGPADNLGVETLLRIVRALYKPERSPRGCFLFIVDAFALRRGAGTVARDPRKFLDFIVDDNVMDAFEVLLSLRRQEILREVGFKEKEESIGANPYREFLIFPDKPDGPRCAVWHFTFRRLVLGTWPNRPPQAEDVQGVANRTATQFRLSGAGKTARELQDNLFEAAWLLVKEDIESRQQVCRWFQNRGFTDLGCARLAQPDASDPGR